MVLFMNAEPPVYEKREFYGPLKLSEDTPNNLYRYMLEHPDDSSKLVRTTDGLYCNQEDMGEHVRITQQVLQGLKDHGINHVNPSYIDESSEQGKPYLLIVVDKLKDFEPYSKLIDRGDLTSEQAHEADLALNHMFSFLEQAMSENGYIDTEMMHLEQFVYDPSQLKGQKIVLVDVEPIGGEKVDMKEDSMEHGYPSSLAITVAKLAADAINLARKTGYHVESLQKAAEIIDLLPGESELTNQMKADLLRALDSRELTPEVMYFANGGFVDEDDDEYPED
jgi:hypothetical protein